jgi:AraC-like DNA-binding protein
MRLLEILSAIGAFQGVLLLILIGLRYRHHKNLPLAVLIVVLSVRLGTIPYWSQQHLLSYPWLLPATTPLPFLFAFLVWWYARELVQSTDATPPLLFLHLLPYLADTAATTLIATGTGQEQYVNLIQDVFYGQPPLWMTLRNILKVAINTVYMVLAVRIGFGRGKTIKTLRERLPRSRSVWLRTIVIVPILSLAAFAYVAVNPVPTALVSEGRILPFAVVAAALVIIIYTCSVMALLAPDVLSCACSRPDAALGRDTDAECVRLAAAVQEKLASGAFQDPRLSLRMLAQELDTHPNRLSQAINHVCETSFPHLVNRYRLEYFLERVKTGGLHENSILDIAFDAGFSSKSTFNRVFKAETGSSPSEYIIARSS